MSSGKSQGCPVDVPFNQSIEHHVWHIWIYLMLKSPVVSSFHGWIMLTSHVCWWNPPYGEILEEVLLAPQNLGTLERLSLKDCTQCSRMSQAALVKLLQGEAGAQLRVWDSDWLCESYMCILYIIMYTCMCVHIVHIYMCVCVRNYITRLYIVKLHMVHDALR